MLANVPRPGKDFGGATRYLIFGAALTKLNPKRVLWIATRNLMTDDPLCAAKIMTATAALSRRAERPVYHLIVSWAPEERPTRQAMEQVIATTLTEIGLDRHQALIVAHGDTANPHVHLLINRIDPDTGTAWSTRHDYRRIERSIFAQAGAMGFKAVPGRHSGSGAKRELTRVRSKGAMLQARNDKTLPMPWTRSQTAAVAPVLNRLLSEAATWSEAVARVRAFGGELERKGQGLVIRDRRRTGYVKFSSLGTEIRVKDLEQRFGKTLEAFEREGGFTTGGNTYAQEETDLERLLAGGAPGDRTAAAEAMQRARLDTGALHTREMRALKRTLAKVGGPDQERRDEASARTDEPEPQR